MDYKDKWLVCADCGRQFLWDFGEQAWYHDKKLENQPRHCKPCRDRRRDERMRQPRQSSKVNCDRCGSPTFVPFVPLGIKPIYCRMCLSCVRA
ncbi:MAG: zinc-ribbon domain containing protein [Chloroflexota bacterium]|nr:zinc-ribbon domain containing protein [Chloroflexota bacterium]